MSTFETNGMCWCGNRDDLFWPPRESLTRFHENDTLRTFHDPEGRFHAHMIQTVREQSDDDRAEEARAFMDGFTDAELERWSGGQDPHGGRHK